MLVDVVEMRATGMKLTPEELGEGQRVRGHLRLQGRTAFLTGREDAPAYVGDLLAPLQRARIERMQGNVFVVRGEQRVSGTVAEPQPQAWLCTLVRA